MAQNIYCGGLCPGVYPLVLGASLISYTQEWVANVEVVFC